MSDDRRPGVAPDRIAGTLVGLAAGDALGAGYEFASPPAGRAGMIGGGLGDWAPGEWTDDTQMAVCVARGLRPGTVDLDAIGAGFLDWYAGGPADVGNQTRAVLGAVTDPAALPAAAAEHYHRNPRGSAGNGSLMRTAPVALAFVAAAGAADEALAQAARAVSALTHADPLAGDACVLWCIGIDRALREDRLDGAWDGLDLVARVRRDGWRARLDQARTIPPATFNPNGFVVAALQAALAAVLQTPVPRRHPERHLEDALHAAVRIGDDTDTVAAIAGGLLGARWGADAVPPAWRELLHGWPGLRTADLATLALRAAGLD
jgi:ADP-ribosyl-[dinitrogen reductase] hydrolase